VDWIKGNGPLAGLAIGLASDLRALTESNNRASPYHLEAWGAVEVVDADQEVGDVRLWASMGDVVVVVCCCRSVPSMKGWACPNFLCLCGWYAHDE
jgi:hypothetical protein